MLPAPWLDVARLPNLWADSLPTRSVGCGASWGLFPRWAPSAELSEDPRHHSPWMLSLAGARDMGPDVPLGPSARRSKGQTRSHGRDFGLSRLWW